MPVVLITSYKLVCLFILLISLESTHPTHLIDRNEIITKGFHADNPRKLSVTVPQADEIENQLTRHSIETEIKPKNRQRRKSVMSIVNHCLDRHLSWGLINPLLIFTAIIGLFNGPLYAIKVLLFSIQLNVIFPTFVCSFTVRKFYYSDSSFFNNKCYSSRRTGLATVTRITSRQSESTVMRKSFSRFFPDFSCIYSIVHTSSANCI